MMNGLPPHTDNNWAIKIIKTSLQLNLVPILSRSLTLARWEKTGSIFVKIFGVFGKIHVSSALDLIQDD